MKEHKSFTDLIVWQKGHELVITVYKGTTTFPKQFLSLANQMERAAVSFTSNIAEGFGRDSARDRSHFYVMARGSLAELQNQILVARDVSAMSRTRFTQLADQTVDCYKLINALIKANKAKFSSL